jgi:predicted XRE-type DNA-binding protein
MTEEIEVYTSCGNIFVDLGFPNAEEMLVKAELVRKINNIIIERNLTDLDVAKTLEIEVNQVPNLLHGRLLSFPLESLLKFLNILGQDIEINVKTTTRNNPQGKILVNLS